MIVGLLDVSFELSFFDDGVGDILWKRQWGQGKEQISCADFIQFCKDIGYEERATTLFAIGKIEEKQHIFDSEFPS